MMEARQMKNKEVKEKKIDDEYVINFFLDESGKLKDKYRTD